MLHFLAFSTQFIFSFGRRVGNYFFVALWNREKFDVLTIKEEFAYPELS